MSLPTVLLDDEPANLQNGCFLDIDRSSTTSTTGRHSNELDPGLDPDHPVPKPNSKPKERPKTAPEGRCTESLKIYPYTARQSQGNLGTIMSESTSPSLGPPYRQKLPSGFLKGIEERFDSPKSTNESQLSGNETASDALYMVDRFPSLKKKDKQPALVPPPKPQSPHVRAGSSKQLGGVDDDPITAVLQRPYPIPVHDPEKSITPPVEEQPSATSERTLPSIPRRPAQVRSPAVLRDEVRERMGEQDVAKIRQLEEKNSRIFANQKLLPDPIATSRIASKKPKRKKTKTPWQSIPFGPAAPGSTYEVTATSASTSILENPTSPSAIAREHRMKALTRAREAISKDKEPEPSYPRDSGIRTAREALEAAATERFFNRDKYDAGQNDDNIRSLPMVNTNISEPMRRYTGSPRAQVFFSPLPPLPASSLEPTEKPRQHEPVSEAQPARLEGRALYRASTRLVPEFACYDDIEQSGIQQSEIQAMGSIDSLGKEMLPRSLSLDSHAELRDAQLGSGGTAWTQKMAGILMSFNVYGIVMSSPLLFVYYAWVLPKMPLSTIVWVGGLQLFFLFSIPPVTTSLVDGGLFRAPLLFGSFFAVVSPLGLSFIDVPVINDLDSSLLGALITLQGLILGAGLGLISGAGRQVLARSVERGIGALMGSCAVAGVLGAVTYQIVIAYGIPKLGFAWAVRVLALIGLLTLLPATFLARNPSNPSYYRKPSKAPEMHWDTLRDKGFVLTLSGFFFSFWGLSSAFYLLPLTPTYILQIPAPAPLATTLTFSFLALISYSLTPLLSSLFLGPLNTLILSALVSSICLFLWITITNEAGLLLLTAFLGLGAGSITGLISPACLEEPSPKHNKINFNAQPISNPRQSSAAAPRQTPKSKPQKQQAPLRLALLYTAIALACLSGPPIAGALAGARDVSMQMQSPPLAPPPPSPSSSTTMATMTSSADTRGLTSISTQPSATSTAIASGMPTGIAETPSELVYDDEIERIYPDTGSGGGDDDAEEDEEDPEKGKTSAKERKISQITRVEGTGGGDSREDAIDEGDRLENLNGLSSSSSTVTKGSPPASSAKTQHHLPSLTPVLPHKIESSDQAGSPSLSDDNDGLIIRYSPNNIETLQQKKQKQKRNTPGSTHNVLLRTQIFAGSALGVGMLFFLAARVVSSVGG